MEEVQFDEEGIKFRYLSNWKEQNKEINLNGMAVYNIITTAEEGGKTLENNTSALINDGNMYVFELMHFKEFPHAYNDYLAIMDSVEFE